MHGSRVKKNHCPRKQWLELENIGSNEVSQRQTSQMVPLTYRTKRSKAKQDKNKPKFLSAKWRGPEDGWSIGG